MTSLYYRDASATIICYDIGDEKSFTSVHYWITETQNNNTQAEEGNENFVMALCGNKSDIDPKYRKINLNLALETAKKHDMIFSETSAKTGEGI